MGCDMAWKSEAASPLTGGNFRKLPGYTCATVSFWSSHHSEWSCQWHHFLMCISLYTQAKSKRYKSKNFWDYDRLQELDHSLGGYSHRERRSRTRWNIKFKKKRDLKLFCAGYDERRWQSRIHFWAYTQNNSTIALGATPIGSAGRALDEDGNIGFTTGVKYQIPHQ
jgi:hypothetical protein